MEESEEIGGRERNTEGPGEEAQWVSVHLALTRLWAPLGTRQRQEEL